MWPWRKKENNYYRGPRRHDDQLDAALYSFKEWFNMRNEKEKEMHINYTDKNLNLKNVKLKSGLNRWGTMDYWLRLVYEFENDHGKYEIIVPKMLIPIDPNQLELIETSGLCTMEHYADIGLGKCTLLKGIGHDPKTEAYYTVKELEKKVHKMTVADIEKKLGYKIEIVSEEKDG